MKRRTVDKKITRTQLLIGSNIAYTEEQKQAKLAAYHQLLEQGLSKQKAAKKVAVPRSTLMDWGKKIWTPDIKSQGHGITTWGGQAKEIQLDGSYISALKNRLEFLSQSRAKLLLEEQRIRDLLEML